MISEGERKKVKIIYTGGLSQLGVDSDKKLDKLFSSFIEISLLSDVDIVYIDNVNGVDVDWGMVSKIGQEILRDYDDYDGFVIIHSSDNVEYVASLMRFCIHSIGKPVIFTGISWINYLQKSSLSLSSEEQMRYRELSLRTNLVSAIQLALSDCSGVLLAYGSKIVRAVRAIRPVYNDADIFASFGESDVAKIQLGIKLLAGASKRFVSQPTVDFSFSTDIDIFDLNPSLKMSNSIIDNKKAVVILGCNEYAISKILKLPTNIPVVILSSGEVVNVGENIIHVCNATFPAVVAKTMICVDKAASVKEFKDLFWNIEHDEFFDL